MAKFESFEDMLVWQKSKILVLDIYKAFNNNKDYSFRDQICRAAVSVMNNIAEGYERKGNKEFVKFLYIAKGSCAEVRSMLYLGIDLGYIQKMEFEKTYNQSLEISKMLSSLIKKIC
jgi:four helix bundle protein